MKKETSSRKCRLKIIKKMRSNDSNRIDNCAYVIKYVNKRVVAFKVLSISNAQLKLSTSQGDVLVYDKI